MVAADTDLLIGQITAVPASATTSGIERLGPHRTASARATEEETSPDRMELRCKVLVSWQRARPGTRSIASVLMGTDGRALRALQYPYEIPRGSFLFDVSQQRVGPLPEDDLHNWTDARKPVLAIGSNAAPQQLGDKFSSFCGNSDIFCGNSDIPALQVELAEHDVVYAARVSSYGAIPATLAPSPGTAVTVKLLLLTDAQLEWMNSTESVGTGYDLVAIPLDLVRFETDAWSQQLAQHAQAWCYVALSGPLELAGSPAALKAIEAARRRWPALSEDQVLARVARAFEWDLHGFIEAVVTDEDFRDSVNEALRLTTVRIA